MPAESIGVSPPREPSGTHESQAPQSREKLGLERFGDFRVTDHPDNIHEGRDELTRLYSRLKGTRIKSVRYDWRWGNDQPVRYGFDSEQMKHNQIVREVMQDVGLEAPTIILLSSPPKWAVDMYKRGDEAGREQFYSAYRKYAVEVKRVMDEGRGEPIKQIQIMNELNNTIYTPIATEHIPRICEITRDIFGPDVKLSATVLATNLYNNPVGKRIGTPIEEYLDKYGQILKDNFDIIGVDYYPSTWHFPAEAVKETAQLWARSIPRMQMPETHSFFRTLAGNMTLLKKVYGKLSELGIDHELGEVGRPSKKAVGGEKYQKLFYEAFFEAYGKMLDEMGEDQRRPLGVDLYMLRDEPANYLTFVPGMKQQQWGILTDKGDEKKAAELFHKKPS
ncbi:MAG TPA: hypothetical protein VLG12_06470 [Candidatus Saccharimonadales bacterium]|nr:hypothetical protein [Candidatus Saccharimonadales bacterium]